MAQYAPDINPVAFSLGPIDIRWYALAYILGFILVYLLFIPTAKKLPLAINREQKELKQILEDIFSYSVLGVIIGGRLGWVLFYSDILSTHPLDAFKVWQGGMSFHGGLAGVIVACALYAYFKHKPFLQITDVLATLAPIGLFFGRIANFVNGELWGRPSDVAWAMIFKHADELPRHPSQLYEAALEGLLLFIIMQMALRMRWFNKAVGRLSALFLLGYGLARFTVEYFREPDPGLGNVIFGLTMGQSLTLLMFAAAIALMMLSDANKGDNHDKRA